MTTRDRWSATLRDKLPGAKIVGELADEAGFLIIVNGKANSDTLQAIESALQAAGADSWHWSAVSGEIKVRAYCARRSWCLVLTVAAVLVFIALAAKARYDVHPVA